MIGEAPDLRRDKRCKAPLMPGSQLARFMTKRGGAGPSQWLLAGLCLLRDLPNYGVSLSTKIVEYSALGVPVNYDAVTACMPTSSDRRMSASRCHGMIPAAVVDAILRLRAEPELRLPAGCQRARGCAAVSTTGITYRRTSSAS